MVFRLLRKFINYVMGKILLDFVNRFIINSTVGLMFVGQQLEIWRLCEC